MNTAFGVQLTGADTVAIVTITEAAALAGVSRGTLYNRFEDGTLSRSEGGVDTSELLRVFGSLGAPAEPAGRASARQIDVSADVSDTPVDVQSGPLTEADAQLAEVLERRLARADEDTRRGFGSCSPSARACDRREGAPTRRGADAPRRA